MTSGGARTRSGPAPDFSSLKRDRDGKEWTKLPTTCSKPVPPWPIVVAEPTIAELAMWDELWAMPQAHVWHADRVHHQVALYCRMFIEGAKPRASSQLRITLRQSGDQLLLSIPALHAARYVITGSPEASILEGIAASTGTEGRTAHPGRPSGSARSRMQVVPNPPADAPIAEPGSDE